MTQKVFLSYAWHDRDRIDMVLQQLQEKDITVVNLPGALEASSSDIELSQDLRIEIRKQIEMAGTVVVFWTKEAAASDWVQYEIGLADALSKPVIVVAEESAPKMPLSIAGSQAITFKEPGAEEGSAKRYGSKASLLIADNDASFMHTRKKLLESEGYQVIAAASPEEARRILKEKHIDLAIVDVRLMDDSDEQDISGLELASEVDSSIPKIIYTQYPSVESVRSALTPSRGLTPSVDFLSKTEGPEELLRAIRAGLRRNVFIGHGRDEPAVLTVARFIEDLGLRPIVLREQLSGGRTIIESVESYANVGFAVVLLTPEDTGDPLAAGVRDPARPRQTVIFELGYFIGKLGRRKVCILRKGEVEVPSDLRGVRYISMDPNQAWKYSLAKEMRFAGMNIDLERLASH